MTDDQRERLDHVLPEWLARDVKAVCPNDCHVEWHVVNFAGGEAETQLRDMFGSTPNASGSHIFVIGTFVPGEHPRP